MKFVNKLFKCILSLSLVVALTSGTIVKVDAASKATKSINSTYGSITGEISGGVGYLGKEFESGAFTTKKVPKIYTDIDVKYYTTGKTIAKVNHWETNSNAAVVMVKMERYKNALNNNKKDGFKKTKCTAYGCAEAIVKKSYTVYTSCVC